mgnify:FL=1|tara:strand:+ start:60 stop:1112 length:1053 start_codon:yes stop_codon:yes gene_type:complete
MRDLKYLFAYSIPLSTFFSIYLHGMWAYSSVFYAFVIIPLIEWRLKQPNTIYSDQEKKSRLKNKLFDLMLYLNVPIVFGLLSYGLLALNQEFFSTYERVGILSSLGILLATNAINVAHELGHRSSRFERTLSKLLYMPCLYMHFFLEHNYGHHKNMATADDPATARYNQPLYSFWISSVINQYKNAWNIQFRLLANKQKSFFSFENDMLFYLLFQGLYLGGIFTYLGSDGLLMALIVGISSFLFLETINYIEHYGLRRVALPSGKYERITALHSWNSNHIMGRIVLYELTRHSDHHFKSNKKYQVLEHKEESPQLPFGYPTAMLLALIPPMWFRVMNSRIPINMLPEKMS